MHKTTPRMFGWLATAILLATAAPHANADTTCTDQDKSGGFGGQDVGCDFSCQKNSLVSVYVDAADKNASVSGTADCGGSHAECSDDSDASNCQSTDPKLTTASADGKCSATSSEFYDSGLYVKCSAEVQDITGHVDPPIPRTCVIKNPDLVCTGTCGPTQTSSCLTDDAIRTVATIIHADGGIVSALTCTKRLCVPVPVVCVTTLGSRTCTA